MTLRGMLSTAEDGTLGFDCNQVLTDEQIQLFVADKFKFVFRYVPRVVRGPLDLKTDEAQRILDGGLGLGIVQHVSAAPAGRDGWQAVGEKGHRYGEKAAIEARLIGCPSGMHVWLDLEGVETGSDPRDVAAYCIEWYKAVDGAGFNAGLYVGWQPGLTGEQLYSLPFTAYWRAFNLNRDQYPMPRGFQIKQDKEKLAHGVRYDPDTVSADEMGDRCFFLWPQ
jgi:hypothetical protein